MSSDWRALESDSDNTGFLETFFASPVMRDLWRFEVTEFRKSGATMEVDVRPELGHLPGWFQGTTITAIAEFAGGLAGLATLPRGWSAATVDQHIKFIGPARGERLVAKARVIRPGRTITTCQCEVYAVENGAERLCAVMLQTNHQAPLAAKG